MAAWWKLNSPGCRRKRRSYRRARALLGRQRHKMPRARSRRQPERHAPCLFRAMPKTRRRWFRPKLERLNLCGCNRWEPGCGRTSVYSAIPPCRAPRTSARIPHRADNFEIDLRTRYRSKFGSEPARTATLSYDAVTLVDGADKTQGTKRFAPEVLTNSSGFTGIDGVFRFRSDGSNQRGLAVLRVTQSGGQVISPAPRSFASGT